MKCPSCSNDIAYSKSWKINRWSSVECSHCGAYLNRKLDLQSIIIYLLLIGGPIGILLIIPFIWLNWGIMITIILGIFLILLWTLLILYLDSKTICLVPVEKRQGIKAILGHKYIKKD